MKPYNKNKPTVSWKGLPTDLPELIDRLHEAGIPFTTALKYFHENPEGPASETLNLATDETVPFKYQIRSGDASPSSVVQEALMLAMPTRAGKAAERSVFKPKDPNRQSVVLSHKPIEPDAQLNKAIADIDDLYRVDDQYSGGPNILDYEMRPFDDRLGPSDYIDINEVRRYANEDMPNAKYYNDQIKDYASYEPHYSKYIDYLDADDIARYQGAADQFRNAINQADYNDIVIGRPDKYHPIISKSAQDLAKDIENGKFALPDHYPIDQLIEHDKLVKDNWMDAIESGNYSITQQDLQNIMATYPEVSVGGPEYYALYQDMMKKIANNPSKEAEIRTMYRKMLSDLKDINDLPGND